MMQQHLRSTYTTLETTTSYAPNNTTSGPNNNVLSRIASRFAQASNDQSNKTNNNNNNNNEINKQPRTIWDKILCEAECGDPQIALKQLRDAINNTNTNDSMAKAPSPYPNFFTKLHNILSHPAKRMISADAAFQIYDEMKKQQITPNAQFTHFLLSVLADSGHEATFTIFDEITNNNTNTNTDNDNDMHQQQQQQQQQYPDGLRPYLYTFALKACRRSGQLSRGLMMWSEWQRQGVELNNFHFSSFIALCAQAKKLDLALELLTRMRDTGTPPDAVTMGALLNACVEARDKNKVRALAKKIRAHSMENVVVFNTLLKHCLLHGDYRRGMQLARHMDRLGIPKDRYTYATLIALCQYKFGDQRRLYANAPDARQTGTRFQRSISDTAVWLYEDMLRREIQPDAVVFSALVNVLLLTRDRRLFQIYHHLRRDTEMSPAVYHTTMRLCAFLKQYDLGLELFQAMKHKGFELDEHIYTAAIHLCRFKKDADLAWTLFTEMLRSGIKASIMPTNALMNVFCDTDDRRVFDVFNLMQSKLKLRPDVVTYNILLRWCVMHRDIKLALSYLKEMGTRQVKETYETYIHLFDLCAATKQADMAFMFYYSLKNTPGMKMSSITYNALINALGQCGDPRIFDVYAQMKADGFMPRRLTTTLMLNACKQARAFDRAQNIWELETAAIWRDTINYTAMIDLCVSINTPESNDYAISVFEDMKERDIMPNLLTYGLMMRLYLRMRRPDKVKKLYKEFLRRGYKPDQYIKIILDSVSAEQEEEGDEEEVEEEPKKSLADEWGLTSWQQQQQQQERLAAAINSGINNNNNNSKRNSSSSSRNIQQQQSIDCASEEEEEEQRTGGDDDDNNNSSSSTNNSGGGGGRGGGIEDEEGAENLSFLKSRRR